VTRSVIALTVLGWLVASVAHSQLSRYLVIENDLQTRTNGDLYSAALVTCYGFSGFDPDCSITGEHYIYDELTQAHIGGHPYSVAGEYNNFVRAALMTDGDRHCYRAFVDGHIGGSDYYNFQRTFRRCFDAPEPIDTHDCPILVDLDTNGFHLSGVEDAVRFDLDADGFAERLSWTAAGEQDGFLCRDLNGNGTIDDGRELFSRQTLLASGERAEIAYWALAELDLPELGGNADGVV